MSLATTSRLESAYNLRLGRRLFGVETEIHWSCWALLLFVAATNLATEGPWEALHSVGMVAAALLSVVAHELGHGFLGEYFGGKMQRLYLTMLGGVLYLEGPKEPRKCIDVALAGPAVSAALGLAFTGVALVFAEGILRDLFLQLVGFNFLLMAFNLLPAYPLDGAQAALAFGEHRGHWVEMRKAIEGTSWVVAVTMCLMGMVLHVFVLPILSVFLIDGALTLRRANRQLFLNMRSIQEFSHQIRKSPGGITAPLVAWRFSDEGEIITRIYFPIAADTYLHIASTTGQPSSGKFDIVVEDVETGALEMLLSRTQEATDIFEWLGRELDQCYRGEP